MRVYCGIDWASDHHDVAVLDADGKLLAKARIADDAIGFAQLIGVLADHGDTVDDPVRAENSSSQVTRPFGLRRRRHF